MTKETTPTKNSPTLEYGIPIPARATNQRSRPVYSMPVGASYFVAGVKSGSSAAVTAYQAAKIAGYKITIRAVDGGIRIWRVE